MKNIIFALLFFGFTIFICAQDTPKVGDALIVNEPYGNTYKHVKFPRLNTLTKRGKLGNYKSVHGDLVIIDEVITKDNETTYVILKKKDGTKFFGYLAKVKANYSKSIHSGELSIVKS